MQNVSEVERELNRVLDGRMYWVEPTLVAGAQNEEGRNKPNGDVISVMELFGEVPVDDCVVWALDFRDRASSFLRAASWRQSFSAWIN